MKLKTFKYSLFPKKNTHKTLLQCRRGVESIPISYPPPPYSAYVTAAADVSRGQVQIIGGRRFSEVMGSFTGPSPMLIFKTCSLLTSVRIYSKVSSRFFFSLIEVNDFLPSFFVRFFSVSLFFLILFFLYLFRDLVGDSSSDMDKKTEQMHF